MKAIGIVTDSHSGITRQEAERLGIRVLPMPFYIGGECYYEDATLTRDAFFEKLDSGAEITTSQPSPAEVMKIWDEALEEYEQILYIPISSGLSGSCQTADMLARDEPYRGRVLVVDNGRVSALLHRSILDALELIGEGYPAAQVREILEEYRAKQVIYIGVETLEHLKRGGRISAATAALGTILNIKPVLKFDVGTLATYKKCRGMAKARKAMLEVMHYDMEHQFKEWADEGGLYLMAATSARAEETTGWLEEIRESFPGMEILCDELSLGLSCHIGQGGLGIGWSCRPRRPAKKG